MGKKSEKFTKFMERNAEWIVPVTGILAVAGLYVVAVVATGKQQQRSIDAYNAWAKEENQFIDETKAEGKSLAYLIDGTYLVFPEDTPTEVIDRR